MISCICFRFLRVIGFKYFTPGSMHHPKVERSMGSGQSVLEEVKKNNLPLRGFIGSCSLMCYASSLQNLSIFLHGMNPNESHCDVLGLDWKKMALIWREREHEENDINAPNDTVIV